LVFFDESGFLLQPLRRRVWAPRGHAPRQAVWDRHDRLSVLAALTLAPRENRIGLHYQFFPHNIHATDVVQFLRQLHRRLRHRLWLVCDRWSVHRSAVRRLEAASCPWVDVEWLPSDAPELDPVEFVWNQAKYGDLANWIPDDLNDLKHELDRRLTGYQHDSRRLHSFFAAAHLKL
jgi:transposase